MDQQRYFGLVKNCLSWLIKEERFALEGGALLNLGELAFARYPTVIPIRYLPIEGRQETIQHHTQAFSEMQHFFSDVEVVLDMKRDQIERVILKQSDITLNIFPNYIMRGSFLPTKQENLLGYEVSTLDHAEVYAVKLYQVLHRQEPRDLFDAELIFHKVQANTLVRQLLVAYIACSPRPIHELLQPALFDLKATYHMDLVPLMNNECSLERLIALRQELIHWLHRSLSDEEKQFLLSVKKGQPIYQLMPFENLPHMPAMQWKLQNIEKLHHEKQARIVQKLENLFY